MLLLLVLLSVLRNHFIGTEVIVNTGVGSGIVDTGVGAAGTGIVHPPQYDARYFSAVCGTIDGGGCETSFALVSGARVSVV